MSRPVKSISIGREEPGGRGGDPKGRLVFVLAIALAAWTALAGVGVLWIFDSSEAGIIELARMTAAAEWRKDILYRRWNASHSPVYAAVTDEAGPNPYLADQPERDLTTPSGVRLTLINPAYMTRLVHEMGTGDGVHGHITSINPIRPENAPDEWEHKALMRLAAGEAEVAEVGTFRDGEHLRLMRPLVTEESCLKCHQKQGYKAGDIRGGISVAVELAPLRLATAGNTRAMILVTALLWLAGAGALVLGGRWLIKGIEGRLAAEAALLAFREKEAENERLAALGTLSGGIAHNFNNILTVVTGYSSFVREEIEAAGMDTGYIDEVIRAGGRAARLVAKLGSLVEAHEPFGETAGLAEAAARALDGMREFTGRAVDLRIPDDARVQADSDALCNSLAALISNAFLAGDGSISGGGPVIVDAVKISTGPDNDNSDKTGNDWWEIRVRDSGCGMGPEVLKRAFEPFFTTRDVGAGDGLGLTLVKAQVESSGGSVSVSSSTGIGTIVTIRLLASSGL